jgi:hypothetical protein
LISQNENVGKGLGYDPRSKKKNNNKKNKKSTPPSKIITFLKDVEKEIEKDKNTVVGGDATRGAKPIIIVFPESINPSYVLCKEKIWTCL